MITDCFTSLVEYFCDVMSHSNRTLYFGGRDMFGNCQNLEKILNSSKNPDTSLLSVLVATWPSPSLTPYCPLLFPLMTPYFSLSPSSFVHWTFCLNDRYNFLLEIVSIEFVTEWFFFPCFYLTRNPRIFVTIFPFRWWINKTRKKEREKNKPYTNKSDHRWLVVGLTMVYRQQPEPWYYLSIYLSIYHFRPLVQISEKKKKCYSFFFIK